MATYSIPEGETTKIARGLGKRRRSVTKKYKRKGPGKSPLVPVNRAEQIAAMAGKKRPSSGKSAMAPGQRKKALGLKSARTLAPGHTKRATAPAGPAGNPLPGSGGTAKAAAIASKRPRPTRTLHNGGAMRASAGARHALPSAPPSPPAAGAAKRPSMSNAGGATRGLARAQQVAEMRGRRKSPGKAGARRARLGM